MKIKNILKHIRAHFNEMYSFQKIVQFLANTKNLEKLITKKNQNSRNYAITRNCQLLEINEKY